MSLRIRRGTDAQRSGITFDMGEIVWTTDGRQLWVGDGLTQGGFPVVGANIAGFGLAYDPTTRRLEVSGLSADNITNGTNNKFFATELAQDAAASLFVTGTHTNISFVYDDSLGKINATVTLDGTGITDIVADTSPQLGGNLDLNQRDITGVGSIDITGNIELTGTFTNTDVTLSDNRIVSNAVPPAEAVGNSDNALLIGSREVPNTLWVYSDRNFGVFTGITDGVDNCGISLKISRGTTLAPTVLQPNDIAGYIETLGYDGDDYINMGAFGLVVSPDQVITPGFVPGTFGVLLPTSTGGLSALTFSNTGILNAPIIKATPYATPNLPATNGAASEGFIVFDTTTKQFKGFNGTTWVVLG
jgi:hypothetical protein